MSPPHTSHPVTTWRSAAIALLALFLPVVCLGCGAADRAVCEPCRTQLQGLPGRVRLVAGVRLDAAFEYDGLVRTLLLELKLRGRVDVAAVLARRTGALVRDALAASPPDTVLLRVPSSRRGNRRRGFDPVVLLLARGGVRRPASLRRVRRPPGDPGLPSGRATQKERTAVERVAATVGTLRADGVAGCTVVLVDDVVTTGVTMAEAVRAVRAAGGTVTRCVATASVEGPPPRVNAR